jgi:transposase
MQSGHACNGICLKKIWADAAYRGQELAAWCQATGEWELEVVERAPGTRGFSVVPRRWVVERTFSWISRNRRRISKGYERKAQMSETPAFARFRENSTHLLFWLSPLGALVALIFFSLKWTDWEADLSGWQIALGPWGLDLIDFPHSLPAVWLVFWFIPFTALFVLGPSIARLFCVRLRWLRFWAVLLQEHCKRGLVAG